MQQPLAGEVRGLAAPRRIPWPLAQARRSPVLSACLLVIGIFVLLALCAPLLSHYDPEAPDYAASLQAPGAHHLLGTDQFGRDILTRLMYGARVTLLTAVGATALATLAGMGFGLLSGYLGGIFDTVVGRLVDAMFAFPALLLAVALTAILQPSESTASIAITIIIIPEFARISRNAMIAEKAREYVEASRSLGSSAIYIIIRSILPNLRGPLLVLLSIGFSDAVLYEAALSFLGLGAQPPTSSWGWMLNDGRSYLFQAPWYAFSSGLAIFLLLLAVNLSGDSLRQLSGVDV
jgi:ABC-type dipeptide/oligopeptide/nickel transport system permease subunit